MSLIKKYNKLEKKANQYFNKYEGECAEMMHLITPLLQFPMHFHEQYIFKQDGDGYVLVTETTDGILKNTPVSSILKWFEKTGELIDEDILYKLSI